MFDREIRGQLAMLMGGRAAEEVSCDAGACVLCCGFRCAISRALPCWPPWPFAAFRLRPALLSPLSSLVQ